MDSSILDWSAAHARGPAVAGGKGWQLGRLQRYGLPVPPGFVIAAECGARWLNAGDLRGDLQAALAAAEPDRDTALAACRARMAEQPPPPELATALAEAIATRGWGAMRLAVRSSAVGEDSAKASFAGIFRSVLNVGANELAEAVREVWISLWTPAAVAYRERFGFSHAEAAMAVVVMPLLPARAAGIAFTCDPLSGRDDRIVVHAQHGLGESLVGGHSDADEYVFEENPVDDRLRPVTRRRAARLRIARPAPGGGTRLDAATAGESAQPALPETRALELANLARDAAQALEYAAPFYDIEWVDDGERLWLVQARPVTTRPQHAYEWLKSQPQIWSNGNTRDTVPMVLCPFDWGASRKLVNLLLEEGLRLAGYPLLPGAQRAGLVNGRLHLNLSLLQWELFDAFGVAPAAFNRLAGGHQPEIATPPAGRRDRLRRAGYMLRFTVAATRGRRRGERAIAEAHRRAARWLAAPIAADDAGLAGQIEALARDLRGETTLFFLQGAGGGSLSLLLDLLERYVPGRSHALAAALLAGGPPSVTARQGYELQELAAAAAGDPAARAWLAAREDKPGDWLQLPEDSPFRRAFAAFLDAYGHRAVYETDQRNPRWREEPDYLLDSIAGLASTDPAALSARQRESVAEARREVKRHCPWWARLLVDALVKAAAKECNGREAARSALVRYMEPNRRFLLAAGARLADRGLLDRPDDVFNLMLPEILRVLRNGGVQAGGLTARVGDRRQRMEAWEREPAPDVVIDDAQEQFLPATADESARVGSDGRWYGIAVGSGSARGVARRIDHPDDGHRLKNGEILVAPSTDPGWTPLFLKAGALVMETGGYLSHGAIVAREFGIPAVVNLPGILAAVADGARLEVDGRRGSVEILSMSGSE